MNLVDTLTGRQLHGDWRRRSGTLTDAHLYRRGDDQPACRRRIHRSSTVAMPRGRACTDCLVAEMTRHRQATS